MTLLCLNNVNEKDGKDIVLRTVIPILRNVLTKKRHKKEIGNFSELRCKWQVTEGEYVYK